jgi:hypothetical protein
VDLVTEKLLVGKSTTKSKERVRDQAEVFTSAEQVTAMLNLVRDCSDNISSRFLEPSCGNGNFLIAILNRKLSVVSARYKGQKDFEFYTLIALSSIYGVDICLENVKESRERMRTHVIDWYSDKHNTVKPTPGFYRSVDYILEKNIIQGDMLNGVAAIQFSEFTSPKLYKFKERIFRLTDLLSSDGLFTIEDKSMPIFESRIKSYLEIGNV